ncbi:MAG TPA: tetratricopeptide repeat protein [Steroidobacteraceae bacterium]|nr:tetratricopeptide repeat protein [Steroidobacteraceae bacterium]
MRIAHYGVLSASLLLATAATAWANGGGGMPMAMPMPPRQATPQDQARDAYNDGVRYVKKADRYAGDATQQSDAGKKEKATKEAHDNYGSALGKFETAVQLDPSLYEAWNYLGYTNRKLGDYDDALAAYGKALSIKPGYADALEYRGEAYLGVNRVSDAQQAYLDLYPSNRQLASKLLTAMKAYVATQRATPSAGTTTASLDDLDKWIHEREQIAGQTAALTRAGAAASWH